MTAIAAVVHRGQVWMASDSRCSADDLAVHQRGPKVAVHGDALIGSAGDGASERVVAVVDWARGPDAWPAQLIKQRDALGVTCAFQLIVGWQGRLYYIEDGIAYQPEESYAAAGSGSACVLGYLAATCGRAPAERVRGAVRAAIRHVPSCGGRIHIVTI